MASWEHGAMINAVKCDRHGLTMSVVIASCSGPRAASVGLASLRRFFALLAWAGARAGAMSRQLACADGRDHALPPNHRPPSASDADVVAGRPPIEEQLRLVTSARLRLRLSRERFDSARAVFYSMKRAVAAATEELV
ncbi:hypothetical protein THAOC_03568, partial [Thalassiosira oceanica]